MFWTWEPCLTNFSAVSELHPYLRLPSSGWNSQRQGACHRAARELYSRGQTRVQEPEPFWLQTVSWIYDLITSITKSFKTTTCLCSIPQSLSPHKFVTWLCLTKWNSVLVIHSHIYRGPTFWELFGHRWPIIREQPIEWNNLRSEFSCFFTILKIIY